MEVFFKLLKLLYPFIRDSILGNDSLVSAMRKRKVFLVVVVGNLTLFFLAMMAAEQGLVLIDRLAEVKSKLVVSEQANQHLLAQNSRLSQILHGNIDEVCFNYFSKGYEPPKELVSTEDNTASPDEGITP